jgi:hypothetical protein
VGKACDDMYVSNQCHFEEIKAVSRGFWSLRQHWSQPQSQWSHDYGLKTSLK